MWVTHTERLSVRYLRETDASFILALYNTERFHQYIGDLKLRDLDDALLYLKNGPLAMYKEQGIGLYLVELRDTGIAIGICGLIKRASLDGVDIGFALMPEYCRVGYGYEAANAVLAYARDVIQLTRLLAITQEDNQASIALLKKLGLCFENMIHLEQDSEALALYCVEFTEGAYKLSSSTRISSS